MKSYAHNAPPRHSSQRALTATNFTLLELLILTACAGLSIKFATHGLAALGVSFFLTVLAFRTAIVDFTLLGGIATLMTILFGTTTIAFLVLWSTTW